MVGQTSGQASLIGKSLGNYEVKALIGRGALGTVYLATDVALSRPVALKVLLGSLAHNPEHVKRFLYEAQAAAPLRHANIVGIYEAGIREGTPFIAMEYVEGEPLDRFLRRRGKALPWLNALHIALQVAEALDCAHTQGITHRDVKPANILLDYHGRIRLSDFGIARLCQDAEEDAAMEGVRGSEILPFKGTPDYMSPEQCRGESEIGFQTDLYSLGVTLFQMITGRMPFESRSTIALINSILTVSPPRLAQLVPGIPDDVSRLVAHLMEKDPHKRPASARAVCEMIQRLYREQGGTSAMPKALNSFIREESEPRKFKTNTPAPGRKAHTPKPAAGLKKAPRTPLIRYVAVVMGGVIAVSLLGMSIVHFLRPMERVEAAPRLTHAIFTEEKMGIQRVSLPAGPWSVNDLHWVGSHPVVLLDMEGDAGTLAAGGWGWLAVDLGQREVMSPRTPTGSLLDEDYGRLWAEVPYSGMVPDTPAMSPLHDVRLANVQKGNLVVTLTQQWNSSTPDVQPLCREVEDAAGLGASVAVKPDGHTLCAISHERGDSLLEFDVSQRGAPRGEVRLTEAGAPILARSVHYSSDGSAIAYIRAKHGDEYELWVVG
ncbi:MAG TPA: serine/threonine-protein kinase, partial [Candidatus Hydrogenedentes bacterium]|nr:serine/threonine-protein kinase [Candidatus Hydrogenedentota bacterium]